MTFLRKSLILLVGGLAAICAVMFSPPAPRETAHQNAATLQQELLPLAGLGLLFALIVGVSCSVGMTGGIVAGLVCFAVLDLCAAFTVPRSAGVLYVNTPGTIVGAQIIQRALRLTFTKFPALTTFALGFKELDGRVESANLGQDVYSRVLNVSPITNFESGASDFNWSDVPGKLRNFRQIHHRFTAAEVNSTDLRYIDMAAQPMAIGLAQGLSAAMVGMVSRTNFNSTVNSISPVLSVASGWTYANTLVPLIGALNDRGVPDMGDRFILANSAVNGALLTDTNLVAALNNPANASVIQAGKFPQIQAGLQYGVYPNFAASDSNLIGLAGTPDALMYIARAPKSPDEVFAAAAAKAPFAWAIITDELTGFSVLVQQWIETNLAVNTRIVWLDGYQVGNATNMIRIINGVVSGTSGVPVATAKVTNPGYGYVNSSNVVTAPTVTVVPVGAGSGATAVATVDTVGGITGITISGGTGYTTGFTLTIAAAGGGKAAAPATATGTTSGLN